ncbi:MAG TPA: ABC transporter substrate-binding protein [Acidimicrobiales bacterium]|nr:ABC transporter substrate-binding protein [Acidimicrobiales bacterium]
MRRRTFLKGMVGVAGGVLLGGCGGNGGRPGGAGGLRVRVQSWTQLGFPSPFRYTAGPGYWRMSLIFDTLTWADESGEQLPWLASSYRRSEDGLRYTVDLRDVSWADGRPLTPRDVAFTYEYYTTQLFTPLLVGVPRGGAEVAVTGERSVEFRLQRPNFTFLQQVLGTMPIVPEHVWSKISDPQSAEGPETLMGTGAYTLASRDDAQDRESYQARDGYFLGRPFVRRIDMLPADDALTALRVGELDAAPADEEGATNAVLEPFRDESRYGIIAQEAGFGFPLFFNMTRGGALADLRFRRACLHAMDREDMVKRLLTGNGQVGSAGWLAPVNPYYDPGVRSYPFDRAEAERLLDEGGYRRSGRGGNRTNADGSPLRLVLYIPDLVPIALAELVANALKQVGIDVDLQRIDLVRLFGVKAQKAYDLLITSYPGPAGIGPTGDPEILRSTFHSQATDSFHKASGYNNPEVDRLLDIQLSALSVEDRRPPVNRIQRIVADDIPAMMLYYTTYFYVFRKNVFDQWYFTPGGFGPGLPDPYNKHPYITGRKRGLEVREAGD